MPDPLEVPTMTRTITPSATHELTLSTLTALNAEYDALMRRDPDEFRYEDQAVAMAEVHRCESQAWSDMDIHATPGATGSLLIRARSSAVARAEGLALSLTRTATRAGNLRYRQDLRGAQRSDRVLAYGDSI